MKKLLVLLGFLVLGAVLPALIYAQSADFPNTFPADCVPGCVGPACSRPRPRRFLDSWLARTAIHGDGIHVRRLAGARSSTRQAPSWSP